MNNEPVAWMDSWGDVEKFNHNNENWTPLYTHPPAQQWTIDAKVKELTDEEIDEVAQALIDDCSYCSLHFARAILRKAQENG